MSHLRQFVNFYSIRVRTKFAREDHDFGELDGKHSPLPDVLKEFKNLFEDIKKKDKNDSDAKTTTKITNFKADQKNRRYWGMIEHGNYGVTGSLLDVDTSKRTRIKRSHSPMYGFYFQTYFPKSGRLGLLALHSRGKSGCKTALTNCIRQYFKKKFPNISIFINPINVDFEDRDSFFSKYRIKKVRFITFEPKRLDHQVLKRSLKPDEKVTVDRCVQVGRYGGSLVSFPAFVKDPIKETRKVIKRYVEIPDQGEPVQMHVTVEMDGQEKTIRLDRDVPQFDVSLDFTEELPADEQFDPSQDALHVACTKLLNDAVENVVGD